MVDYTDIMIACIVAAPGWFAAYRLIVQSRSEALNKTAEQIIGPYRQKIEELKCEVVELKHLLLAEQEKRRKLEDGDLDELRREIEQLKLIIKNSKT